MGKDILGISAFYHDSSACLLRDGKVVAAVQQERFSRKKNDLAFPKEAVEYCLKEGGIGMKDVGLVAFYEKPYLKFERLLYQFVETFPRSLPAFVESIPSWLSEKLVVPKYIKDMGYKGKFCYPEHHQSHAASAYLCSGFDRAAILTVDGVGEWATTTFGKGEKNRVEITKEIDFPHSLGLLYSAFTAYLGFRVNNSEYKVMGLAPYGRPVYSDIFDRIVKLYDDGSFALDMSYFVYHYMKRMPSAKLEKEFGQPVRSSGEKVTQFHKDVAASLQAKTEEVMLHLINRLYSETKIKNLCIAGGCGLNSVANGRILSKTGFRRLFIQPASGDAGGAIGAALYAYNTIRGNRKRYRMKSAFLGPAYSDAEIKSYLEANRIKHTRFSSQKELSAKVAELISRDSVIGWFQGRMEWGPRALGARSILSNPCNPRMQDILNLKVKHREKFRPFAPVILLEKVHEWFEADRPVPEPADYMLMVYPIKKGKRKLIPAVTHVDGSGRLQVIRRNQHPLYYDTIKEFGRLTGVPILINTSFNIRGEPIVCSPHHAYRCMTGTGIDYLCMGSYLIKRDDNPQDHWDSEKHAKN
jgi:carbamoyltransferase